MIDRIKPDVVLASPSALGSYFRAEGMAAFNAPLFERSPLKTRAFAFIEAAPIRSICA